MAVLARTIFLLGLLKHQSQDPRWIQRSSTTRAEVLKIKL